MANRNFKRIQSLNNEAKIVAGSFSVDTGAATKLAGLGYTVAGTDTGEFTITCDRYPALISATATIQVAGGANLFAQVESFNALTGVVVLNTVNAAGAPTATDCTVHFTLIFNNSTVA